MKLNIGAGSTRYEGYINCDYDTFYNPEFVFDLEKDPWPFDDNSVSNVILHHILEHLGEGYFHCIKELYRVCEPNALIDIRVPHYNHHWFHHDPTHRRAITPYGLSLFSLKQNELDFINGSASSKLGQFFKVDFEVISEEYIIDELAKEKYKDIPQQKLMHYAYEHNNIICEIHIKLMAIKGTREEQIKGYYKNLLGRDADNQGLNHYLHSNFSMQEIKNILINSGEYKNVHN
jgi:hypothetical protein